MTKVNIISGFLGAGKTTFIKKLLKEVYTDEQVVLIEVFMPAVRLAQTNKSVNRTVTLPAWLNAEALSMGINFSQVLQKALMEELSIQK